MAFGPEMFLRIKESRDLKAKAHTVAPEQAARGPSDRKKASRQHEGLFVALGRGRQTGKERGGYDLGAPEAWRGQRGA